MGIYKFFRISFIGFTIATLLTGSIIYYQSLILQKNVTQMVSVEEPLEKAVLEVEILSWKIANAAKSIAYLNQPKFIDSLKNTQSQLNNQITLIKQLNILRTG